MIASGRGQNIVTNSSRRLFEGLPLPFLVGTDARNNVYMTQSPQLSVQNIPDSSD